MISLQQLISNPDIYKNELKKRFKDETLIDQIITLHNDYRPLQTELESKRQIKNQFNDVVIKLVGEEKITKINEMKNTSNQIKQLEEQTKNLYSQITELIHLVPNISWEGIPVGPDDNSNVEIAQYGVKPEFNFNPLNYYDLPVFKRDYLGKKGVDASGFRGYYIQGELARLQLALFSWTLNRLIAKGFNYIIPPVFVNEEVMLGTGFFPTGREDCYEIIDENSPKFLPGTSEAALMYLHSNETLNLLDPIKLTAWTRCFRKEAGAYGKDTRGGIRVTQFEKIETVYLTRPEDSQKAFEEMKNIFYETADLLELYYHDLEVCSGDNSNKNNRMIDIEAWFPAQGTFRELCSASNCTDYQTRTLNITTHDSSGNKVLAHSLNCTGMVNRTLFAILEQNQLENGSVKIPDVLIPFFGDILE